MKVLVACEESQEVCKAFRELGHMAFSCDILPCSGGHPEWHIQGDVLELLKKGVGFITQNGDTYWLNRWDLIIAFPPCTYLTNAAAARLYPKKGVLNEERYRKGLKAKEFFMKFYNYECERICIENPISSRIFNLPKYSQQIEPFMFGHPFRKKTRLWLKGLPELKPTDIVTENIRSWVNGGSKDGQGNRRKCLGVTHSSINRSKTFPGIAKAMAKQWG